MPTPREQDLESRALGAEAARDALTLRSPSAVRRPCGCVVGRDPGAAGCAQPSLHAAEVSLVNPVDRAVAAARERRCGYCHRGRGDDHKLGCQRPPALSRIAILQCAECGRCSTCTCTRYRKRPHLCAACDRRFTRDRTNPLTVARRIIGTLHGTFALLALSRLRDTYPLSPRRASTVVLDEGERLVREVGLSAYAAAEVVGVSGGSLNGRLRHSGYGSRQCGCGRRGRHRSGCALRIGVAP